MLLVLRALKHDSWETRTAGDGREALSVLSDFPPDLVITDLLMPVMDGEDLIRQLREAGFSGPVVMVTAVDLERTFRPKLVPGVTLQIRKPVSVSRMRRTVERLLGITEDARPRAQLD